MTEEEFEHIPWSELAAADGDRRTRMLYLGLAAAAAVVLGIVAARWLAGPDHGAAGVGEESAPVATTAVVTTVPSSTTSLLSEADLRVEAAVGGEHLAAMRAEWFVTDYFTVDGSDRALADVEAAFAAGVDVPSLPHEAAELAGATYVEWARSYETSPDGAGRYLVAVAFRTIYLDGDAYRRSPVRAVEVPIVVDDAGRSAVADLPSPIPPPGAGPLRIEPGPTGEAPPGVAETALEYAWIFDGEPEVISASGSAERWRVVLALHDASGITFPVVVRSAAGR